MPQLLVIGVAVVELVEVTDEYKALKLKIKDCGDVLTSSEVPGVLVLEDATDETKGEVSVTKSVQSFELDVVIVRVFFGAVVATSGKLSYPFTISVFLGIKTAQ
jgi:hypothetical protein